eukprot:6656543-Prymnesium_polylepis.1
MGGVMDKIDDCSIPIGVLIEHSSDLERRAAPRSIAGQFFTLDPNGYRVMRVPIRAVFHTDVVHIYWIWEPDCEHSLG